MRTLILAAAFVLSASVAQAQIVVVAEIPTSQRQGTYTSASFTIPVDAEGYGRVIADMNDADYLEPTNSAWIRMYEQRDGVWIEMAGVRWVGGPQSDVDLGVNPRPFAEIYLPHFRGRLVRAELDVPTRMRIGARLETSVAPFW